MDDPCSISCPEEPCAYHEMEQAVAQALFQAREKAREEGYAEGANAVAEAVRYTTSKDCPMSMSGQEFAYNAAREALPKPKNV